MYEQTGTSMQEAVIAVMQQDRALAAAELAACYAAGDQRGIAMCRAQLERIERCIANEQRPARLSADINRVRRDLAHAEMWNPATVPTLERVLDGLLADRVYWLRRLGRLGNDPGTEEVA